LTILEADHQNVAIWGEFHDRGHLFEVLFVYDDVGLGMPDDQVLVVSYCGEEGLGRVQGEEDLLVLES
jgi:hypothetical protein